MPNGNVRLTWVPPADPANTFDSYEIFSSTVFNGPYTNIGAVGALGVNTYTHATNVGTIQSVYYFMKTKSGPGGSLSSINSDTLRSVFLNAVQSTPDVKLSYNNLHLPALPTTASTFTLSKEYPMGTWGILGTTSALKYADTISVCSASINYVVEILDNSGCSSVSNVQGNTFSDTKTPNQPVVDSISVLPNGQTVLAWEIPKDQDVTDYTIYERVNGINTQTGSVSDRSTTIVTYTNTKANSQAVQLFVAAEDSCGRISSFDIKPTTMFLKTKYNTCAYATELQWNAYVGMKNGISEYKIYYSVNGSAFVPVGSTTGTSFVHEGVDPSQSLCYFVRVFNSDRTITSSSNKACFFSTQALAPDYVYISAASIVDDSTAEIKILLDISKPSAGIDLMRSEDGVNFGSIAFLAANGSAQYAYTDAGIDAHNTSYVYRAVVRDSCDNPRIKSNDSKTILLKVHEDKEIIFNKNLSWTDYKGFAGGVSGYNIYRIVNDVVPNSPVGTTGPMDTTYTDNIEEEAPNGSKIDYYVEAVEGIGNPYGLQETCKSNKEAVYQEAKIFVPTAFAPNGVNKTWLPVTHFVDKTDYELTVYNRWGNKMFQTSDDKEGWDGKNGSAGVYAYLIVYRNSRGEYIELKGTFTML